MNWKYGNLEKENDSIFERILERVESALQWLYDNTVNLIINLSGRAIHVRIDNRDIWNMDVTLSYIVHPMLEKLKASKHGAAFVDMEDVPGHLRASLAEIEKYNISGHTDSKFFARWNFVLDEMIWAFEQKRREDTTDIPVEDMDNIQTRMRNGFRLFGKYYNCLWD